MLWQLPFRTFFCGLGVLGGGGGCDYLRIEIEPHYHVIAPSAKIVVSHLPFSPFPPLLEWVSFPLIGDVRIWGNQNCIYTNRQLRITT